MQRETMINDDRCRRVMKKFRKRRRQKSAFLTTTSLRLETLGKPTVRRRCVASDEKEDGDDVTDEEKEAFNPHQGRNNSHQFIPQNSHKHHNHDNQKYRRRNHIDWGERLARRRAFASGKVNDNCRENSNANSISSEPELVHRKPESLHASSIYSSCTFLDSYDKVIAVDTRGNVDLIRLADIRSQRQNRRQMKEKTTVSHDKLVTDFELGAELQQQSFSTVHVQPLFGGRTVAFGLADDSLCLLDLERGRNRNVFVGQNDDETMNPISFSTGSFSSSLLSPLTGSRTKYPRRTHYRDRRNPKLSLHELCRHRMNHHVVDCQKNRNRMNSTNYASRHTTDDISELHAINYTTGRERISSPVRFIPGLRPPHDARWDILEVHPRSNQETSLLYVAHVDSDYDAFWTQVIDGRVRPAKAITTAKGNGKECNATTILIDGTTRDRPGTVEEHVTACAMVTDICMATAHISCGNYGSTPASEFFDRGLPYAGYSGMSSCVKLWDLRMAKVKRKMMENFLIPADSIVFDVHPSFENADFTIVEPSVTIRTRLTSGDGALTFSDASFADGSCVNRGCDAEKGSSVGCSDHVITNLSAARDPCYGPNNNGSARGGSLIATIQSRTKSTRIEHAKLDLSGTMRMARKISQTNSNLECQPVYAIAPTHKYLATCSNIENRNATDSSDGNFCRRLSQASTRLCLYNLDEAPPRTKLVPSGGRSYSLSSRLRQQQREDPTWSFQIDASLTDRYGVRTELSCIAMNSNGTSLLGGTTDGDLFVWRSI